MENQQEIIDYILAEMNNAEGWCFLSKKAIGDEMQICLLSPHKEDALLCIMHWLKQEPEIWNAIKKTIDESIAT